MAARCTWCLSGDVILLGEHRALGMQAGFHARTGFCAIDRSDCLAKGVALGHVFLGSLNGLDAAPFPPAFGFDLAHLFAGMMSGAVVTEMSIGHEYLGSKNLAGQSYTMPNHSWLEIFAGRGPTGAKIPALPQGSIDVKKAGLPLLFL